MRRRCNMHMRACAEAAASRSMRACMQPAAGATYVLQCLLGPPRLFACRRPFSRRHTQVVRLKIEGIDTAAACAKWNFDLPGWVNQTNGCHRYDCA
jgi:hypothetical protein